MLPYGGGWRTNVTTRSRPLLRSAATRQPEVSHACDWGRELKLDEFVHHWRSQAEAGSGRLTKA